MSESQLPQPTPASMPTPHRRRPRYRGKNPRRFEEKYKEHNPGRYADTFAKVLAAGKTPAGTHRPIMVAEILEVLAPQPGELAVDCTLGYGGHAQEILPRLQPGGRLLGLDADPIELPKTETRLRALGFGPEIFTAHRSNFAGLPQVLAAFFSSHSSSEGGAGRGDTSPDGRAPCAPEPDGRRGSAEWQSAVSRIGNPPASPELGSSADCQSATQQTTSLRYAGWEKNPSPRFTGADIILADLGVSSMQIDDPSRGFSVKLPGPLDMRMNPQRGQTARALLEKIRPAALADLLFENADEPNAPTLAAALAGRSFATTTALAEAIRAAAPRLGRDESELTVRRVFQALRIAVNDEFSALDTWLRNLPACLNPGGRVAVLTFHSGEDRRVKKTFEAGWRDGAYTEIAREIMRPTPEERLANPRAAPAKLRWARRAES